MDHTMNWFPWGGGIMIFLWWIPVIIGILFLVKWIAQQSSRPDRDKSALDILKERYSRGEISQEEFERLKKEITT